MLVSCLLIGGLASLASCLASGRDGWLICSLARLLRGLKIGQAYWLVGGRKSWWLCEQVERRARVTLS